MADFYLKSGAGAVPRTNSAVVALGAKIVIDRADVTANYLVVRKWVWECTTAGTTGAAVPAWPSAVTQDTTTVTDGTAVWTARKPGFSSGTTVNWTFAAIYVDYLVTAIAAGDTIYQSNNDAGSFAAAITIAFPGTNASPNRFLCVGDTVTSGFTLATTGQIITTGASSINITGSVNFNGTIFKCGSGASTATITFAAYDVVQAYENCDLIIVSTGINSRLDFGSPSSINYGFVRFKNCRMSFGIANQGIRLFTSHLFWDGGSIITGSAVPTAFIISSGSSSRIQSGVFSGVDFTNLGAAANLCGLGESPQDVLFRNCKLPATWTGALTTGTAVLSSRVRMHNCDNADTNYRIWEESYTGSIKSETIIVKTGGASDGTTALAWKMASSAIAKYPLLPLVSGEIFSEWIETVGVAKTITVEIIHDSLTALTDAEVWLEIIHLGTVGFPLGVFANDSKANVLATAANQTASTATWTTTGLTNPNKQKLEVTFTPQEKGVVICRVVVAKASYTVYVDPLATIT